MLTEDRVREFAEVESFDEIAVALSLLCDLPIGAIERALVHDHSDQILVLAKSIGLSWQTTKALLTTQVGSRGGSPHEIEQSHAAFTKLKPDKDRDQVLPAPRTGGQALAELRS